ncbi:MAG: Flp family type IVb pilin [Acidimicrobiales bacterium]
MFLVTLYLSVTGWVERRLDRSESGASMVEYALLVALIAIVCVVALTALGKNIAGLFKSACSSMSATNVSSC